LRPYAAGEAIAFGGFYGALANGFVTASHILGLPRLAAMLLWDDKAEPPEVYEVGGVFSCYIHLTRSLKAPVFKT
jgi:hypothetical protein